MSTLQKDLFKHGHFLEHEQDEQEDGDALGELNDIPNPRHARSKQKYAPVAWNVYFDTAEDVVIPDTSDFFDYSFRVYRINAPTKNNPVFVFHHGAGHSGLSFALTAQHIKTLTNGQCSMVAIDARGHGETRTSNDTDFALETLSNDLTHVLQTLYMDEKPDLILVGHSMGGSVVVDVAYRKRLANVVGVCVLDVVEGSAMDALASMTKILSTRPQHFKSVEQAVEWGVKSNTIRKLESAKVSFPPLIQKSGSSEYRWRTDLTKTTPFWTEWFDQLSSKFLGCPVAKLLILAGTDRLDKPLMIGQMQGKFQLHIIPEAGHFVQEDAPENTAQCLVEFWKRNKRLVLPPKVQIKK